MHPLRESKVIVAYMESQWLSTGEAAVRLNVSREWVRLLVQRGDLRAERARSGFLIDPESVEDYAIHHRAEERAVTQRRVEEARQRLVKAQETYPRFTPAEADALL